MIVAETQLATENSEVAALRAQLAHRSLGARSHATGIRPHPSADCSLVEVAAVLFLAP